MSWTYDATQLATNVLYQVRFLIGDNDPKALQFQYLQKIQDEELNFLISQEGNCYKAAAMACQALFAKYASLVTKSVGDLRITYSDLVKHYEELEKKLMTRSAQRFDMAYAGGISISDKQIDNVDPDRVPPTFERNQFNIPGSDLPNGDYGNRYLQEEGSTGI